MRRRIPTNEATDAELSQRARRGDRAAWRALIKRHSPMVYRLSVRMLGPGPEAEDACQEAFMKMHRSIESYDPARPMGPWLGRITYHECLKRMAKTKRAGLPTDPATFGFVEDARRPSPEGAAAAREAGHLVTAALERLSAQDRALVTMRYRDGLTDVEVAEAVGMNRNTVRTRLHRARMALRKTLAPVLGRHGGDT